MKFIGKKGNWHRIMSSPDSEIKDLLVILFQYFLEQKTSIDFKTFLIEKTSSNLELLDKKSWRYYFIKYDIITDKPLFTITNENSNYQTIEMYDKPALQSYHINPFVFTLINNKDISSFIDYYKCWAINSDLSVLVLKNQLRLEQKNNYWEILNLDIIPHKADVIIKFNLKTEGDKYHYCCNNLVDDIIDFIKFINN